MADDLALACTPPYQMAVVYAGELVSRPFTLDNARFMALERPGPWQDAPDVAGAAIDFTVQVSATDGEYGSWLDLYDENGAQISITTGVVEDGPRAVGLDAFAVALAPFRYCRFVASVAPDVDRFLAVHLKD